MEEKNIDDILVTDFFDLMSAEKQEIDSRCIGIGEFNDKDWEALKESNTIVDGRYTYGVRSEKGDRPCTDLSWSNGGKRWILGGSHPNHNNLHLDANEICVNFSPKRMERVYCYLRDLPLYYASFEAKERKDVDPDEALQIFVDGHGVYEHAKLLDDIIAKIDYETTGMEIKGEGDVMKQTKEMIKKEGWGFFFKEED